MKKIKSIAKRAAVVVVVGGVIGGCVYLLVKETCILTVLVAGAEAEYGQDKGVEMLKGLMEKGVAELKG